MEDKKNFNDNSEKLIKSFEEQNRILNEFLKKLDNEYQQKFQSEQAIEDMKNTRLNKRNKIK